MALPAVTQTILDGASGALALGSDLHVKVGVSSTGTADTLVIYTDPDDLETDYGTGPLVEAAAYHISATGLPVGIVRCASGTVTAGTLGAITKVDSHGGPTITDSTTASNDAYEVLLEIVLGGAVATATFKMSLDGGDTFGATTVTAATVSNIYSSGINLAFAAGTYVAGDQYSATTTPPTVSALGVSNAIDAAFENGTEFRLIHVVGHASAGSGTATSAAAVQTIMNSAALNDYRYAYAVLDAADDTDANLVTAFASVSANRVAVGAGFCEVISPLTQRYYERSQAWVIVAEIMRRPLSVDPGFFGEGYGSVTGVTELYRDERTDTLLDAARFLTLRTHVGRAGFYVTRGRMMAALGSDFDSNTHRQVMDATCKVTYNALLPYLNADLALDADTGLIIEDEAQAIEADVNGRLAAYITSPGHASDAQFLLDRTYDVLTNETLKVKTRVLRKAYARTIENTLSFRNPALEAAAA
jgi:hypothetical protein